MTEVKSLYDMGFKDGYAKAMADVVLCKECKNHNFCAIEDEARDETFFCKWGERRN